MLDQTLIRRGFTRAAPGFDAHDFLHREIRERLLDRLAAIRIEPVRVLDLGAGTGAAGAALAARFPDADVLAVDLTHAMLKAWPVPNLPHRPRICADAARLPLPNQSIDVIFSNLMLHHCPDPDAVLAEARRVLKHPGLFTFTTFGPNTLIELGRAWATADRHSHISPFADMHNVGDALIRAGFTEPVIDSQILTITYEHLDRLIADLRYTGTCNATEHRNRGLTGRQTCKRLRAAYTALADADGRLPVTIEVIFGIAWAGEARPPRTPGADFEFPLDRLVGARMHSK